MSSTRQIKVDNAISRGVTFAILFLFWLLLSGHYDIFHISLGIISCAIVSYATHDLLFTQIRKVHPWRKTLRFILYIPWLIYQIILANIHVAYLIVRPEKIDPRIVKFTPKLKSDMAKVTLANSITLTPGTITMNIEDDEFIIHALSEKVANDLLTGEMERRVAHIYMERQTEFSTTDRSGESL